MNISMRLLVGQEADNRSRMINENFSDAGSYMLHDQLWSIRASITHEQHDRMSSMSARA